MTRPRMLQSGVRPDKFTFKLEAEGHVVLRDARSAMAAVKSMRNMAGAAFVLNLHAELRASGLSSRNACTSLSCLVSPRAFSLHSYSNRHAACHCLQCSSSLKLSLPSCAPCCCRRRHGLQAAGPCCSVWAAVAAV